MTEPTLNTYQLTLDVWTRSTQRAHRGGWS
jgi:hypothetical protein